MMKREFCWNLCAEVQAGQTETRFVLEHLAEITAIDPAAAGRTFDEVFGLVIWKSAETLA
jgi:hypothetical protein